MCAYSLDHITPSDLELHLFIKLVLECDISFVDGDASTFERQNKLPNF